MLALAAHYTSKKTHRRKRARESAGDNGISLNPHPSGSVIVFSFFALFGYCPQFSVSTSFLFFCCFAATAATSRSCELLAGYFVLCIYIFFFFFRGAREKHLRNRFTRGRAVRSCRSIPGCLVLLLHTCRSCCLPGAVLPDAAGAARTPAKLPRRQPRLEGSEKSGRKSAMEIRSKTASKRSVAVFFFRQPRHPCDSPVATDPIVVFGCMVRLDV